VVGFGLRRLPSDPRDPPSDPKFADANRYSLPTPAATDNYMENGRLYHGFRRGMYMYPCDEVRALLPLLPGSLTLFFASGRKG
jgi:hypothetical protein